MDTTNIQNNNNNSNGESFEELSAQLDKIGEEIKNDRENFIQETQPITELIENEPEISDDDSNDDQEIKKMEDELGAELDAAMIDLAPDAEDDKDTSLK